MHTSMIRLIKPADVVSMLNVGFGFLAILVLILDFVEASLTLHLAFSFILLSLLADGLDGIVARKTGKGVLGEYFEAMADLTSMGIAPTLFILFVYKDQIITFSLWYLFAFILLLLLFLFCCCIRLAAFHPLKSKDFFIGLPASAATIILISCSFLEISFMIVIILIILTSIGMISSIPFPKPSLKMNLSLTIVIVFAITLGNSFSGILPVLLFLIIVFYVIFGPFFIRKNKK